MKATTMILCSLVGVYFARLLYVPMPAEMSSHSEFFFKTVGFKYLSTLMYIKSLFTGGSTIDFSIIQRAIGLMIVAWVPDTPLDGRPNVTTEDTTFDRVRVLFHQQVDSRGQNRPAVVYFHGGGLTVGSVDIYVGATREMAQLLDDMVVVSVDYRLAPEHPFPAAYDDCVAATKWLLTHSEAYGVDPTRITVAGDSAGSYLTTAIVQNIMDDPAFPNIKLQVLLFPWLNHLDFQTPSYQKNWHFFGKNTWIPNTIVASCFSASYNGVVNDSLVAMMMENNHTSAAFKKSPKFRKIFDHTLIPAEFRDPTYYTPPSTSDQGDANIWKELKDTVLDPRFSPILRDDLTGSPKTYVTTCGFDPMRDDGIFFYRRLQEAGVEAEWVNHDEAFHGVDWFGPMATETGRKLRAGVIDFINKNI